MDAFFAAIEQRENPSLKGKPVIVGASPGKRGVVSAASYEARTFGIHSAMPINQAYARCPHGVYLKPNMRLYSRVSKEVFYILESFSPAVEPVSVDEAFIDMTGTEKLWGAPLDAAHTLSLKIRQQLNLTASIGIAPNKFLAKIASDMKKPNGITAVPFDPDKIAAWLAPLNVSKIWGVGIKTQQIFSSWGIHTVGDLQNIPLERLEKRLGKGGKGLFELCRGLDDREVEPVGEAKSISREHTFNADSSDKQEWLSTLLTLSRDVAYRARKADTKGSTIFLTFRTPDFKRCTRQTTLQQPTDLARVIYETVILLLEQEKKWLKSLRLIGVGITSFDNPLQTDLFEPTDKNSSWAASEKAMDKVADRFGRHSIVLAAELWEKKKIK